MENSKKVYMILTNGFDPDVRVYKEAKYLVNKGYNVEILSWDRKCNYIEKKEEILDKIKITRFSILSKPGSGLKQIPAFIKYIKKVKKYLISKDYSYLHCHDFDGIVVGMLTRKKKKSKVIFDMHEIYDDYSYGKNVFFKKIFKYIIKHTDYIIYVNKEQIKNMKNNKKLIYLPNYPEEQIYLPIEKNNASKTRVNYIGSVRDFESLCDLASIDNEKLEIGIYGTGVCLEDLINKYKESSTKIYGAYNGITETGEIYKNTDILYCAYNPNVINWKTAMPVKLFEAIITETPIIISENTDAGDFVKKQGIGELIKYGDRKSIIEAINKITNNRGKYISRLNKIKLNYKWETVVKNLDNIYMGE